MGKGAEGCEDLVVGNPYGVGTILSQLGGKVLDVVADDHSLELHAECVSQLTTLGKELQRYVGNLALLNLDIYKYVIHSPES